MMHKVLILLAMCTAAVTATPITAFQDQIKKGAAQMMLAGGSSGPVPFPHREHQDRLTDCLICHSAFPQEKGSIEKLKNQGQLQKKQVMNKQCIKCHRSEKNAGKSSGPLTCNTCHQKE